MMESAHMYMYTCLCMCVHRDRLGPKFCRCTGTWSPIPWFSSSPYLLGLGRGLGREAGAGTFRDPAVSVIRVHQLGRQAKTRGIQHT